MSGKLMCQEDGHLVNYRALLEMDLSQLASLLNGLMICIRWTRKIEDLSTLCTCMINFHGLKISMLQQWDDLQGP